MPAFIDRLLASNPGDQLGDVALNHGERVAVETALDRGGRRSVRLVLRSRRGVVLALVEVPGHAAAELARLACEAAAEMEAGGRREWPARA